LTILASLLAVLGAGLALAGRYAARAAERRSRARYAEIMAPLRRGRASNEAVEGYHRMATLDTNVQLSRSGDTRQINSWVLQQVNSWEGMQELVGFWGCLYFLLQALQVFGVLIAAAALFYLLANLS